MKIIKPFPTLYSRTSLGAVQSWEIEVADDSFRVISGQVDGQKVVSEWNKCQPKNIGRANETTAEVQALLEAEAKWTKKKKTGYNEDVDKIDSCKTYVQPMLAKNLVDRLDKINWKKGVIVENKFNGARSIATWDDNLERVILTSRKGEEWVSCPHINKDLIPFFLKYPNAVLDGELFNEELREKLNELMKLVRKTKNISAEDLKKSEEIVYFYVYDGFGMENALEEEAPYNARKAWIDENLPKYSKTYRHVKAELVYSMEEVDQIFGKYVEDGHEGVIVRVPDSPYERKRSSNLLKYKPLDDDEGIITDIAEGSGNWAGTGKIITLSWNGRQFNATFKGTWEQATKFLKEKDKWVGKEVKFQFNGLTGLGVPNYARVDIDNCTAEK